MRRGRRLAAAAAALCAALLGAEWSLRRWFPVRGSIYRLDAELLHATVPGARRVQVMPRRAGGGRNLVRINSDGYRGPELDRPGARPRIAVAGDSLVLAANVAEDETFPARLGRELGGAYEVVNVGRESYGPDQTLLELEREIDDLDPDLVVLVLCATNDLGDLLRNKLFHLRDGRLVRERPALHPSIVAYFEESARIAARPALLRVWQFFRESRAARELEERESATPPPDLVQEYLEQAAWEYHNTVVEGDMQVYSLQQDAYDADVAVLPDAPSSRYKVRLLTAVLERMRDACSERGVVLAAVVVPSAVDLDPGFRIRVDAVRHPGYRHDALTDAFAGALERAAIPAIDLYEPFASDDPGSLFVGWEDFHWSARGIERAARHVAEWLRRADLLPQPGE